MFFSSTETWEISLLWTPRKVRLIGEEQDPPGQPKIDVGRAFSDHIPSQVAV